MASELSQTLEKLSIKEDTLRKDLTNLSSLKDNIKIILAENESLKKKLADTTTSAPGQSATGIMFENFLKIHFKRLGIDYEAFSSIFKNEGVYLTGSIVLMGLVGDWWVSDIDVVTTKSSYLNVKRTLVRLGFTFELVASRDREYVERLFNNNLFSKTELWRGVLGSIKVDLIVVQEGKTPIELIKTFDFRFVRNYWDGKMIYCLDPWSVRHKKHQIAVEDIPPAKFRVCSISEYRETRAQKYRLRGFEIAPHFTRPWGGDEGKGRILNEEEEDGSDSELM